jgi:NitT/TauT family transport system permease protein
VARVKLIALQVIVGVLAIALWQIGTTVPVGGSYLLPPFFFSNPADVAARVVKWFVEGTVWRHLWITLYEAMMAFLIGSGAGVVIGFWFARQPMVAAVLDPYVKMINALPRVVLAPIFALWFGLGPASKIALGITLVFFIVFFNVYRACAKSARPSWPTPACSA